VKGQLDHLLHKADYFGKEQDIAAALDRSMKELQRAKDLVTGAIEDEKPYVSVEDDADGRKTEERKKEMAKRKKQPSKL
jgi:hypothetical protein